MKIDNEKKHKTSFKKVDEMIFNISFINNTGQQLFPCKVDNNFLR